MERGFGVLSQTAKVISGFTFELEILTVSTTDVPDLRDSIHPRASTSSRDLVSDLATSIVRLGSLISGPRDLGCQETSGSFTQPGRPTLALPVDLNSLFTPICSDFRVSKTSNSEAAISCSEDGILIRRVRVAGLYVISPPKTELESSDVAWIIFAGTSRKLFLLDHINF